MTDAYTEQKKNQHIAEILHIRLHDLAINHQFAQRQIGFIHSFDESLSEQHQARRVLLDVEKKAQAMMAAQKKAQQQHVDVNAERLHETVLAKVAEKLADVDDVFIQVLAIPDAIATILDLLSTKAITASRLDPLVVTLPWLCDDLVQFINQPKYLKQRNKRVDDPKLAMRYIGIENLQLLVPVWFVKRCVPFSTDPFMFLKRRLWEESMAMGLSAQALAQVNDLKPEVAYCCAMLTTLGKMATTRVFLRTFEETLQNALVTARDERDKPLHDALLAVELDPIYLRQALIELAPKLNLSLLNKMALQRLPLAQAYEAFINNDDDHPYAAVLQKAHWYVTYSMLKENNLIEPEDIKALVSHARFNKAEWQALLGTSMKSLHITLENT